jgi:CubicO group peptidase (beta-lactamase class C family)
MSRTRTTRTENHRPGPITGCALALLVLSIGPFSCGQDTKPTPPAEGYQYEVPPETNDGWETASLASVGMAARPLVNMMNRLDGTAEHNIHSLVIVKNGKLVFEEYFPGDKFNLAQPTGETGFDRDDAHNLCSVTKSFTSALIGIAIDRGFIQSVDQKVFDFFPEHEELLTAVPQKGDITIAHLLTMTAGIEWDDETTSYFDPRNDMYQLFNSFDPIEYILSRDLAVTPGSVFDYSNCNSNVLGEIVRRASGRRLDGFSAMHLFNKLGVTDFQWQMLPDDVVFASGDLRLRPRDMAKFGYLHLNDGLWNGTQIISPEWVEASTGEHIQLDGGPYDMWEDGYGYHWWRWDSIYGVDFEAYMAQGWGGQWIIVCPRRNVVIVSTAGNYYTGTPMPIQTILVEYIIPSIEG